MNNIRNSNWFSTKLVFDFLVAIFIIALIVYANSGDKFMWLFLVIVIPASVLNIMRTIKINKGKKR